MFKRRSRNNPEAEQACAGAQRKQAAASAAASPLTWKEQSLARPAPGPRPISRCSPIRESSEADPRDKR
jgi:hypothetical protein